MRQVGTGNAGIEDWQLDKALEGFYGQAWRRHNGMPAGNPYNALSDSDKMQQRAYMREALRAFLRAWL